MLLLRLVAAFLACEALLVLRLAPGRWLYLSLLLCLAVKYLLLQYVPVYGGYAILFHAAMGMAALEAVLYLLGRISPFGRRMALKGLTRPWYSGTMLLQLLIFRRKTALLRVEPLVVAAYGGFCYLTPIVRAVWLPWFIPLHPTGFVYDEAFYRTMLLAGQALPVLVLAGVILFNRLEWKASPEAFEDAVRQEPASAKGPQAELTFPLLAQKATRGGPRNPSVAELARLFNDP